MLGTLLMLLLGVASLQVWIVVVRRWRLGRPALDPAPRCRSPWLPVASVVAGAYLCFHVLARSGSPSTVDITLVQRGAALGVMEIVIAIGFLTGGFRTRPADVGFPLAGLTRQLTNGALAFLASFGPVFLILLATFALRTEENQHAYLKLLREDPSPLTFGWLLFAAVVVAPVREELLFRVMLQDGLARRIGAAPAIGIVAVLFCLVHGFPDSLALFPLAIVLGYLYQQRQSGISVMVTHALFNLSNLAILLGSVGKPM